MVQQTCARPSCSSMVRLQNAGKSVAQMLLSLPEVRLRGGKGKDLRNISDSRKGGTGRGSSGSFGLRDLACCKAAC
eukprot:3826785-Amphidinium_carterae.1